MSFPTSSNIQDFHGQTHRHSRPDRAREKEMAFPGQRFTVDFDEPAPNLDQGPVIGDIHERAPSKATPPKPPSGSGFPQHKKRFPRSFKQRQTEKRAEAEAGPGPGTQAGTQKDTEKNAIDQENRHQLAAMSNAQIQHEREELMESLDPSLLQRFLQRARIPSSQDIPSPQDIRQTDTPAQDEPAQTAPQTTPAMDRPAQDKPTQANTQLAKDDLPPSSLPEDLHPAAEVPSFHFPTPSTRPAAPSLDPTAPSFLADLQAHYFPNTPHDPSTLDWLQPSPENNNENNENDNPHASPYDPTSTAEAIHPAAIRFSLLGTILAPTTALSLPTSLGLHHHGNDPQAAGYTIPELAILGRSSFPAQRCIAWQILGRILYRLGKGELGDRGSVLVEGLWEVIEHESLVGVMLAEASPESTNPTKSTNPNPAPGTGIGRHASATAWAVEGVWLWQQSGSGDRGLLKEGVIRPR